MNPIALRSDVLLFLCCLVTTLNPALSKGVVARGSRLIWSRPVSTNPVPREQLNSENHTTPTGGVIETQTVPMEDAPKSSGPLIPSSWGHAQGAEGQEGQLIVATQGQETLRAVEPVGVGAASVATPNTGETVPSPDAHLYPVRDDDQDDLVSPGGICTNVTPGGTLSMSPVYEQLSLSLIHI